MPKGSSSSIIKRANGPLNRPSNGPLNRPSNGPLNRPSNGPLNRPSNGPYDDHRRRITGGLRPSRGLTRKQLEDHDKRVEQEMRTELARLKDELARLKGESKRRSIADAYEQTLFRKRPTNMALHDPFSRESSVELYDELLKDDDDDDEWFDMTIPRFPSSFTNKSPESDITSSAKKSKKSTESGEGGEGGEMEMQIAEYLEIMKEMRGWNSRMWGDPSFAMSLTVPPSDYEQYRNDFFRIISKRANASYKTLVQLTCFSMPEEIVYKHETYTIATFSNAPEHMDIAPTVDYISIYTTQTSSSTITLFHIVDTDANQFGNQYGRILNRNEFIADQKTKLQRRIYAIPEIFQHSTCFTFYPYFVATNSSSDAETVSP